MRKTLTILIAILSAFAFTACEGLVPEEGTMVDGYAVIDSNLTWDEDSSDIAVVASQCYTPFTPEHQDYSIPGMAIPEVANQPVVDVKFLEGKFNDASVADCRVQLILEGPAVAESGVWDCRAFQTSVLDFKNLNDNNQRTCIADFNLTR